MSNLREALVEARRSLLELRSASGWDNHTKAGLRAAQRLSELPGSPFLTPHSEQMLLDGDYARFCTYHQIPFTPLVYLDIDGTVCPLGEVDSPLAVVKS